MMENELRIGGNVEGELLCPGQGAQPCLDPCPQSQEWAGTWVGGILRRASGYESHLSVTS